MASFMGRDAWWSVPLAVLIGVPMYSNAAGIIPIVQALLEKGAALGTVLAFMMAVIALSLPEMIILRKVLTVAADRHLRRRRRHAGSCSSATCSTSFCSGAARREGDVEIKVLGPGCANCKRLYQEAERAVAQSGVAATLTKVESMEEIASYGILSTPGLVIDGKVVASGRIPQTPEIVTLIAAAAAAGA